MEEKTLFLSPFRGLTELIKETAREYGKKRPRSLRFVKVSVYFFAHPTCSLFPGKGRISFNFFNPAPLTSLGLTLHDIIIPQPILTRIYISNK